MNRRYTVAMRVARLFTLTGLLALGLLITACSIEDALPAPDCIDGNTVNLGAQSVPTAELVPCFDPLPDGWTVDNVRIDQDGTEVRFDSDRAGDDAAIFHYTEACDIGDAVGAPSEQEGADRFEYIERVDPGFRAQRYYVFPGGCIRWEFDFGEDATAALSIELGDRLRTVTRDALNERIRESFLDERL